MFRIAISNNRIVKLQDGKVTFRFTDSKTKKEMFATLDVHQFIHRFLQHVLPHRFIKARTYGLLSPRRREQFEKAKRLAGVSALKKKEKTEKPEEQEQIVRCPYCKTPMQYVRELHKIKESFLIRSP